MKSHFKLFSCLYFLIGTRTIMKLHRNHTGKTKLLILATLICFVKSSEVSFYAKSNKFTIKKASSTSVFQQSLPYEIYDYVNWLSSLPSVLSRSQIPNFRKSIFYYYSLDGTLLLDQKCAIEEVYGHYHYTQRHPPRIRSSWVVVGVGRCVTVVARSTL